MSGRSEGEVWERRESSTVTRESKEGSYCKMLSTLTAISRDQQRSLVLMYASRVHDEKAGGVSGRSEFGEWKRGESTTTLRFVC